jgi:hypothetical protein
MRANNRSSRACSLVRTGILAAGVLMPVVADQNSHPHPQSCCASGPLTLLSLRAGRKIGATPEIAGLITNNARQINHL